MNIPFYNPSIFNSDDLSIDGGDLISANVGTDLVILPASNYFVFVESILTSCTSDTILFLMESPIPFQISVSDVYLDCNGDVTSVSPIIYGGSVNDDNSKDYISQPHINGLLIGRASLNAKTFYTIISNTEN